MDSFLAIYLVIGLPLVVLLSLIGWIKNRRDTENYFWNQRSMQEAGLEFSIKDGFPILAVFLVAFGLLPITSPSFGARAFALMFFALVGACVLIRHKMMARALALGVPASRLRLRQGDFWALTGVGIWLVFLALLALRETVGS